MQKPYRGDYKPDYEKWKAICKVKSSSIFVILLRWIVFLALIGFIGSYFFDKPNFEYYDFWEHSIPIAEKGYWFLLIVLTALSKVNGATTAFNKNKNDTTHRQYAENEAERRYQEDLDRWYHYQNAEDEVDDRRLAREIKRKRALSQVDNEQLLDMYGRLSTIQYQTNQQAYLFYQEAQNALARGRTYELENSLDDLERALGV